MRSPTLELLWWEGCPSTDRALAELRAALAELGLDHTEVAMREIRTAGEAAQGRFAGSPTILIDGLDFAAPKGAAEAGEETVGLSCRVYRRRDGRISPTPDPDDLRDALRKALGEVEP